MKTIAENEKELDKLLKQKTNYTFNLIKIRIFELGYYL